MLDRCLRMLERLAAPKSDLDARLRIEQLRAVAQAFQATAIAAAIIAAIVGVVALQWVDIWRVIAWFASVMLSLALALVTSKRLLAGFAAPADAARATVRLMAGLLPCMALWPLVVVIGWAPGHPDNNAFLVTFMLASMAYGVPLTAPCRQLILFNAAVDFPILATHALGVHPLMVWLAPLLEVACGAMIFDLCLTHHKLFKSSVLNRFENKDLVERLTRSDGQLKQALFDARRSNNAFLASMSHELRTPLNAIIGFSELIGQHTFGPLTPARYGEYVEDIHASGKHLLGLIDNVLDIAKIESGTRSFNDCELDIAALSRDAFAFVAAEAEANRVSLHSDIDKGVGLIADERAIVQVLTNLLSNAVKFTKAGGRVTLFSNRIAGGIAIGVEDTRNRHERGRSRESAGTLRTGERRDDRQRSRHRPRPAYRPGAPRGAGWLVPYHQRARQRHAGLGRISDGADRRFQRCGLTSGSCSMRCRRQSARAALDASGPQAYIPVRRLALLQVECCHAVRLRPDRHQVPIIIELFGGEHPP